MNAHACTMNHAMTIAFKHRVKESFQELAGVAHADPSLNGHHLVEVIC